MSLLHGKYVVGLLDDAEHLVGTRGVGAKMARVYIGQVIADRATADRSLDFENGFRDLSGFDGVHFENKKCQSLGRLETNPRQFLELIDKPADRFRHITHY
jgi:hypothetical protein